MFIEVFWNKLHIAGCIILKSQQTVGQSTRIIHFYLKGEVPFKNVENWDFPFQLKKKKKKKYNRAILNFQNTPLSIETQPFNPLSTAA